MLRYYVRIGGSCRGERSWHAHNSRDGIRVVAFGFAFRLAWLARILGEFTGAIARESLSKIPFRSRQSNLARAGHSDLANRLREAAQRSGQR